MISPNFFIKISQKNETIECVVHNKSIIFSEFGSSSNNEKENCIQLSSISKITNSNDSATIFYDNCKKMTFYCRNRKAMSEFLNLISPQIQNDSNFLTEKSFNFITEISRGKYSVIKLVENKKTHKQYAMKIVSKSFLSSQNKAWTAVTERNIMTRVNHPFIINLDYSFQNATKFYFCMEYLKFGDLFQYMKKSHRLRFEEIKLFVAEISLAIHYLHSLNIVYRDLKPENIMLTEDGHIKLIDFNLSKELTEKDNSCHSFCGTLEYLAPEIVLKEDYGKSVDWWSLGILIFEMVFNRTLFRAQNQERILSKIANARVIIPNCGNTDLVNLIEGLLKKDPKKRFCFKDIVSHPFFHPLDFDDVLKKKYKPLILPKPITLSKINCEKIHEENYSQDVSSINQDLINVPNFYFERSSQLLS